MNATQRPEVQTLGLFEQRIAGDDSLLKLAARRFQEAGMGTEMHASSSEQLEWLLGFRLSDAPLVLHLPRDESLLASHSVERILRFARGFAGRLRGMVLHDERALVSQSEQYLAAARSLNGELEKIAHSPWLLIEYAVGLEPVDFIEFFSTVADLGRVSACIDIGHVGIRAARAAFAARHRGEDVCSLKTQPPHLPTLLPEVEEAVACGVATVLDVVEAICGLHKPVHFHLHDGHPLSTFSPFGVSDHLSFFREIPLNFEYQGKPGVAPMFGPEGLARVVKRALDACGAADLSFTLEIHPSGERLALGEAAALFTHWTDKTNAEQMNHWLSVLGQNHALLQRAIRTASSTRAHGEHSNPIPRAVP